MTATPTLTGGPSSSPVMCIKPASASLRESHTELAPLGHGEPAQDSHDYVVSGGVGIRTGLAVAVGQHPRYAMSEPSRQILNEYMNGLPGDGSIDEPGVQLAAFFVAEAHLGEFPCEVRSSQSPANYALNRLPSVDVDAPGT